MISFLHHVSFKNYFVSFLMGNLSAFVTPPLKETLMNYFLPVFYLCTHPCTVTHTQK